MSDIAFPKIKTIPEPVKVPPRKACNEAMFLDILFLQLARMGLSLPCGKCGEPLTRGNVRREHLVARKIKLEGWDEANNQEYWHRDPCSLAKDKKDIAAIAKTKRITKQTKGSRKPKAKIKSKGFQNGKDGPYKSPMSGATIKRKAKR